MTDYLVFDRSRLKAQRERAQNNFSQFDFLHHHAAKQILDRLNDINRHFDSGLYIGARTPLSGTSEKIKFLFKTDLNAINNTENFFQCDEEFLPIAPQSLNIILSNLSLHTINDLPGCLVQIRQSLKEDGLFIAAMLGGETLHELRASLSHAEIQVTGGLSPRIFPFADKPQMGDLMQRAGFALPVIDSEIITVTYENIVKLMKDIRFMGEGNALLARHKNIPPRGLFLEAARHYHDNFSEDDGRIVASFEIIYLLGWAPHASQQKPLKPGSAQYSLAQALGADEIKLKDH